MMNDSSSQFACSQTRDTLETCANAQILRPLCLFGINLTCVPQQLTSSTEHSFQNPGYTNQSKLLHLNHSLALVRPDHLS